jgi:hypothetical protein
VEVPRGRTTLAVTARGRRRTRPSASFHGRVTDAELDEEHGSGVRSVMITDADGTASAVTVDAGTAEVLARQVQSQDDRPD